MAERTFALRAENANITLVITPKALEVFRQQDLAAMDYCLLTLGTRHPGEEARDIVARMMLDGVKDGNARRVNLCALWLAYHDPEISGMTSDGAAHQFHYRFAEDARLTA